MRTDHDAQTQPPLAGLGIRSSLAPTISPRMATSGLTSDHGAADGVPARSVQHRLSVADVAWRTLNWMISSRPWHILA